jgi:hypothetical protein
VRSGVRDILIEVGCRGLVGGQEDVIGDIALDLAFSRVPNEGVRTPQS